MPGNSCAEGAAARRRLSLFALAVLAILQGALFALELSGGGRRLWGDEITYWQAARTLVETGRNPLDPLWPPLYPWFLAALRLSRPAIAAAQLLLLLGAALLLGDLGRRFTGGRDAARVGLIAAILLVLDPQVAAFAHYLWPETLHLALFLAMLRMLVGSSDLARPGPREEGSDPGRFAQSALAVGAGLALAGALLAKSLLLPFVPVLVVPLVVAGGRGRSLAALALAVTALAVAPALVANHRQGAGWTLGGSARFNVWVGLNDSSRRNLTGEIVGREMEAYLQSAATPAERNARLASRISALVEREGMGRLALRQLARQPFRLFDRDSFLTDQLPGGAIARSGYGYDRAPDWLATGLRNLGLLFSVAVPLLALVGIARGAAAWSQEGRRWRGVVLGFLAYNLVLFLVVHVKTRYRIQMLPFLDLLAAIGLVSWLDGERLPKRLRAAVALAALTLLGLVLGGRALDERWPQAPLAPLTPLTPLAPAAHPGPSPR